MQHRVAIIALSIMSVMVLVTACTLSDAAIQEAVQAAIAATQEAIPVSTATAIPTHTHTPQPTDTPLPTNTPMPSETPGPTDTPAPSPTPSPTSIPYPTLGPELLSFGGRCIDPITNASYVYFAEGWSLIENLPVHIKAWVDDHEGDFTLLMLYSYTADDWIFIDQLVFNSNGEVIRINPDYTDTEVLNNGEVYEWGYVVLDVEDKELIDKLLAENVLVRFSGPEGSYDSSITKLEAGALKYAYIAYSELLNGTVQLSDFPEICP